MKTLQIPETLREIITLHKDELALEIETPEILRLIAKAHLDGHLKGEIKPAYLISLTMNPGTSKEQKDIHVLGEHVSLRTAYSTSRIVAVSHDLKQVLTNSGSIYQISNLQSAEPSQALILHMCATLHYWRMGRYFGVLEVYY